MTIAILENLPQNRANFLVNKKNIFLDPVLCNFVRPKTSDKLSVNIDHVFCTPTKCFVLNAFLR